MQYPDTEHVAQPTREIRRLSGAFAEACRQEAARCGLTVSCGVGGEPLGRAAEVAFGAWWPEMFLPNVRFMLRVEQLGTELLATCRVEDDPWPIVVHRCPVAETENLEHLVEEAAAPLLTRILERLQKKRDPMR